MSRQQSFEKYYAEQHDVPAETMAQYRWKDKDGYRLPGIAAGYRNFCAGWDAGMKQTFVTVAPHIKQCLVCGSPEGHGGLMCPQMRPFAQLSGVVTEKSIQLTEFKGEDHEQ